MASPGPLPNPYRNPPPNPDRLAEQRSRPTPARRNSKSRKRIEVPLDYGRPLAEYPPEELETDPAGRKCRFVPFNQVKDNLLDPTSYLGPGEEGVMTFLPGYCPSIDNHLSYFGYESELAVTELSKIQAMSDADLRAELEQIEEELQRIPKSHAKPTVAVPGFSTKLTDSIAINADVTKFDWKRLGRLQQFDVITMDPPWQITTGTITRGVNISYHQLDVNIIGEMPLRQVQSNGYIFMWVIASQFANGVLMLERWGYEVETYLNWVKVSKYGRYMPSHGYYMQHNKETVLVGRKGTPMPEMDKSKFESLIVACRESRQSQKPIDIYELIEQVFPGGMYLEIFARPHNLRNGWVSIGIELPT
jgi:N6-adenosine-specific RNA methylase IME4